LKRLILVGGFTILLSLVLAKSFNDQLIHHQTADRPSLTDGVWAGYWQLPGSETGGVFIARADAKRQAMLGCCRPFGLNYTGQFSATFTPPNESAEIGFRLECVYVSSKPIIEQTIAGSATLNPMEDEFIGELQLDRSNDQPGCYTLVMYRSSSKTADTRSLSDAYEQFRAQQKGALNP
jgi:hypothetical protein